MAASDPNDRLRRELGNGSERPGREARLLVLVVSVSLAVLFVLARFRFPAADITVVTPSAAPLAGLAARATFDDMASTMADVLARVSGSIAVVQLEAPEVKPRRGEPVPAPVPARWVPALRVSDDLAIAYAPTGWHPVAGLNLDGPVTLVASDARTQTALVRVPAAGAFPDGLAGALSGFTGLAYAAVVDATPAGASVQPRFLGRVYTTTDEGWPQPEFSIAGQDAPGPGHLIFGINGRLIGLVSGAVDAPRLLTADALQALVGRLRAAPEAGKP
jgi:hypothetical protein